MEVWLAVSGLLALWGGGAGALAYYRNHLGNPAASSTAAPTGDGSDAPFVPPDLGPTTTIDTSTNTVSGVTTAYSSAAGGIVEKTVNGKVVQVSAGIISPIPVGIGPSTIKNYVPPAPTSVDTAATGPAPGYHAAPLLIIPDPSYTGGAINPATQKIVAAPGAPAGAPAAIGTPGGLVPTSYGIVVAL
jgi:hypothetical protein